MSDSDDTDILLLIPPNYYMLSAEEKLLNDDIKIIQKRQYASLQELKTLELQYNQISSRRDFTSQFEAMDLAINKEEDVLATPAPLRNLTTAPYQLLTPTRKAQLNFLNDRLHNMEKEDNIGVDNPSDISSISANTVRTQFGSRRENKEYIGIVHSTPKYMSSSHEQLPVRKNNIDCDKDVVSDLSRVSAHMDGMQFRYTAAVDPYLANSQPKYSNLMEVPPAKKNNYKENPSKIESFLLNDSMPNNESYWQQRRSDDFHKEQTLNTDTLKDLRQNQLTHGKSLPNDIEALPLEKSKIATCYQVLKADDDLISLSEIWGKSGQATAIATSAHTNLKEEKLRRQHLEKTVRQLQARLLEYQQRLSVAIEVDRTKDNALDNAQLENKSLAQELHSIRQRFQESEQQRKSYDVKLEMLQKELAQAVGLASKFQEKNEKLEQELSNCTRKTNESCNQLKKKIDELEIKIHACKRSEELALNELNKIRDKYTKSEHLYEKTKLHCEELEKDNSTLKHQKDMLQEYHQKQKTRADNLDAQRKSLQESLAHLTENDNSLRKKLEMQQKTLKFHYQQQLENVVAQKLKEFQGQLDKTEETLKAEARERERLIAERAVKQLELINEKNELELNLLQEKHNEEVELYRIQLANASKKIDDMEMKLNIYKSKRADIAEKLHNVMETQWQKALEILTSPHNFSQTTHNETEHGSTSTSPETNLTNNVAIYLTNMNKENECETPKTSKKENNLNCTLKNHTAPKDKLQAYIELLLSKSPTDFDRLDEILALTAKAKEAKEKLEKTAKKHCHSKPPWKS